MRIRVKRVYETPSRADGYRVLVDRLWPRGLRKEDARLHEWARQIAPSDKLRKQFGHDPEKWDQFRQRYSRELATQRADLHELIARCPGKTMTLLFAAKDEEHNNAVALKEFLDSHSE